MKAIKSLLCLGLVAISMLFASSSHAQGIITFDTANFDDFSKGQVFYNSNPVGSGFVGQLYISSTVNGTYSAIGSPVAFRTDAGIGYIQGTDITTASPINSTVFYQLRAWNTSAGSTFEQASASQSGIVGTSQSVQATLGGTIAGNPPTVVPFPQANGFNSFNLSLAAVPEPTTIALGVAGGLALLARRRRNA